MNTNLTREEKFFCELYANGDAPFAGNAVKCYTEVFNAQEQTARIEAIKFLAREDVRQYLDEIEKLSFEEARYMKKFLTQNLSKIVEECASRENIDKKGKVLSPAALRSVAVNASKALMEMYPIKEANRLSLEGGDNAGITFNVIVPEAQKK